MLNKIKAINNLGIEVQDIESIEDNIFTISNGEEYYVLTDKEAQEIYEILQTEFIKEFGIEGFTEFAQEYIRNNCMDKSFFDEYMTETHECFVNSLYEEELKELLDIYELETAKDLINEYDSQYNDGYQWYVERFGIEDLPYLIDKHNLLDIDKIIKYCQRIDGRGHMIAAYDGMENEVDIDNITYYIYRIY